MPEPDALPRIPAAVPILDLLLALSFDQFQRPELLLRDIRERDREPDVLRVQDAETPKGPGDPLTYGNRIVTIPLSD